MRQTRGNVTSDSGVTLPANLGKRLPLKRGNVSQKSWETLSQNLGAAELPPNSGTTFPFSFYSVVASDHIVVSIMVASIMVFQYHGRQISWSLVSWSPVSWSPVSWSPVSWSPVSWSPVSSSIQYHGRQYHRRCPHWQMISGTWRHPDGIIAASNCKWHQCGI